MTQQDDYIPVVPAKKALRGFACLAAEARVKSQAKAVATRLKNAELRKNAEADARKQAGESWAFQSEEERATRQAMVQATRRKHLEARRAAELREAAGERVKLQKAARLWKRARTIRDAS